MNEKNQQEQAHNVTELPKQKRSFDWKKIAKHTAFGVAAVGAAVVIFKLANEEPMPEEVPTEEPAPVETPSE